MPERSQNGHEKRAPRHAALARPRVHAAVLARACQGGGCGRGRAARDRRWRQLRVVVHGTSLAMRAPPKRRSAQETGLRVDT